MSDKIKSLTDLPDEQMESFVLSLGEPAYRAKQLRKWIYRGLAVSFDRMTDLPLTFRQALEKVAPLYSLKQVRQMVGSDGTVKTLFSLSDGLTIESALMVYRRDGGGQRYTVCVSTQAGCAIGCPFCATGQQGFQRNLTRGEIIDQALYFARYLKTDSAGGGTSRLTNIVFMGMGEPLANYDALWQAIETLNSPDCFGLGARNMTVSTAGLAPQIERLGKEKLQVGLAVSLHAPDNKLRNRLVPVNRKYPLEELVPACREYFKLTGRRVSFEYALFKSINDSPAQARALASLLQGLNCHVNLIPANFTADTVFQPSPPRVIFAFERELKQEHVNVTLREPRGLDIAAGCGQLRSRFAESVTGRH